MIAYVLRLWQYRYFTLSLVRLDLCNRYRGSLLGIGWTLLHPIAMTAILCLVFSQLFQADIRRFAPYLMTGLACWHYLVNVTLHGCHCYHQGESYIRQYPLPIAIYPLRTTLVWMIHLLLALSVALMLTLFLGRLQPRALWALIPSLMLFFMLGFSLATLAGCCHVRFRDTAHLCEVGFPLLYFLTPIMYEARHLSGTRVEWLTKVNPLIPLLDVARLPILEGRAPSLSTYAAAGAVVLSLLALAIWSLLRLEKRLIYEL